MTKPFLVVATLVLGVCFAGFVQDSKPVPMAGPSGMIAAPLPASTQDSAASIQAEIQSIDKEIAKRSKQISDLQSSPQQSEAVRVEIENLRAAIQGYQSIKDQKNQQLQGFLTRPTSTIESGGQNKRVEELQKELREIQKQLTEKVASANMATQIAKDATTVATAAVLAAESNLKNAISERDAAFASTEQQELELNAKISALQDAVSKKDSESEALNTKISNLAKEVSEKDGAISRARDESSSLKVAVQKADEAGAIANDKAKKADEVRVEAEASQKNWLIAFFVVVVVALLGIAGWVVEYRRRKVGPTPVVLPSRPPVEQIFKNFQDQILQKFPQPSLEQIRILGECRLKYTQWLTNAGLTPLALEADKVACLAVAWAYLELKDWKAAFDSIPLSPILPLPAVDPALIAGTTKRKWNSADAAPAVRLELERARILHSVSIGAWNQTLVKDGKSINDVASESFRLLANSSLPVAVEVEANVCLPNGWNKAVSILYECLNREQNSVGASAARNVVLPVAKDLLQRTQKLIEVGRSPSDLGQLPTLIGEIATQSLNAYGARSTNESQDDLRLPGLYCDVVKLWMSKNPHATQPSNLLEVAYLGLRNLEGTGNWILEGKANRLLIVEAKIKAKEYASLARMILGDWLQACKIEDPSSYKLKIDHYADDLVECAGEDPIGWRESFLGEAVLEGEIRTFALIDSVENPPPPPPPQPTQTESIGLWRFLDVNDQFCDMSNFGGKDIGQVRRAVYYVFNSLSQKERVRNLNIRVKYGNEVLKKVGVFGHPKSAADGIGEQESSVEEGSVNRPLPVNSEFTSIFTPVRFIDFSRLSVPSQLNGGPSKLQIVSRLSPYAPEEVKEVDVHRTAPPPINVSGDNLYAFSALIGIVCGLDNFTPDVLSNTAQVIYLCQQLEIHIGPKMQFANFSSPMDEGAGVTFQDLALVEEAKARRSERLTTNGLTRSSAQLEAEVHFRSLSPEVGQAFQRFIDIQFEDKKIGAQAYSRLTFLTMPRESPGRKPGDQQPSPPPPPRRQQPDDDMMALLAGKRGTSIEAVRAEIDQLQSRNRWIARFEGDYRNADLVAWLRNYGA